MPALNSSDILATAPGESSAVVRERVLAARAIQHDRGSLNAVVPNAALRSVCSLDGPAARLVVEAVDRGGMSARGVHRALRVARTIADLARLQRITHAHLAEALQYRAYEIRRT